MYVCIYMYICIYVCVCIYVCICMYVCMCVRMHGPVLVLVVAAAAAVCFESGLGLDAVGNDLFVDLSLGGRGSMDQIFRHDEGFLGEAVPVAAVGDPDHVLPEPEGDANVRRGRDEADDPEGWSRRCAGGIVGIVFVVERREFNHGWFVVQKAEMDNKEIRNFVY